MKRTKFSRAIPPAKGILWQTLANNIGTRRAWQKLGVSKVCFQWLAVDGYSFIDNPWLPTYSKKIDMADVTKQPWASELIVGLPGYFNEATARSSLDSLTDLGQKFGTLGWSGNIGGFYFPVEIDPTWSAGPAGMAPYWSRLPRPLYVSAYYGYGVQPLTPNGITAKAAALWLYDFLPKDVNLMFQDGIGAFGYNFATVTERLDALYDLFQDRLHVICEANTYNEDYVGVDGTYFRPLTANEYRERLAFHSKWEQRNKLWLFDAPSYLTSNLIQKLQRGDIVNTPVNLNAVKSVSGTIKVSWTSASPAGTTVLGYKVRVYETGGNTVLRTLTTSGNKTSAFYTADMAIEDFGFPPSFFVWDVQEIGYDDSSDFSEQKVSEPEVSDFSQVRVGLAGTSYVGTWFSDYSDIINPGLTATPGTPKGIAAYKLRQELATRMGYDIEEVEVLDIAFGGSFTSKLASDAVSGWTGTNYWWDDSTHSAGPNLTTALSRIAASRITHLFWSGSNDNVAIQFYPANTASYVAASEEGFREALNALSNNGAIPTWVMPNFRSYFGLAPTEGVGNYYIRNNQMAVIATLSYVKIGSYGVGAGAPSGYWVEPGPSYIHQTPAACHATAVEVAQAIAEGLDRTAQAPIWVTKILPTIDVQWVTQYGNVNATWTPSTSSTGLFRARNINLSTGAVISEVIQSENTMVFTVEEQIATYGYTVGIVQFNVAEYDLTTGLTGPENSLLKSY
jgi:hypothetical protein